MKRLSLFATILVVTPSLTFAQKGWSRAYAGGKGLCVEQTTDGGYVATGNKWTILKTNEYGDTLWTRDYEVWGAGVVSLPDGGYAVIGTNYIPSGGEQAVTFIRMDSLGDTLWTRNYGSYPVDTLCSLFKTSDGGYILSGSTYRNNPPNSRDLRLVRADSYGNILWDKTYGDEDWEMGWCVQETNDGGYIISGRKYFYGPGPGREQGDLLLLKIDSEGNQEWIKFYGNDDREENGYYVQQTPDNMYIIVGIRSGTPGWGPSDIWLLKTKPNGDTLWTRSYDFEGYDYAYCVQQTSDGGFIITGETDELDHSDADLVLLKTDSNGDSIWCHVYGGSEADCGKSVRQTSDGGYIITGHTLSFGEGNRGLWLIKTDSAGVVPDEVSPTEVMIPAEIGYKHTLIPTAIFTNMRFGNTYRFYAHCEIFDLEDYGSYCHDSLLVTITLKSWETVEVQYDEWVADTITEYGATFYATGDSIESTPMTVYFKCVTITEQPPVTPVTHLQITQGIGQQIVLRYYDFLYGFHASIYNAAGQKIDEVHSSQTEGIITWGEGFSPGVYFILEVSDHPTTHKVVLVR